MKYFAAMRMNLLLHTIWNKITNIMTKSKITNNDIFWLCHIACKILTSPIRDRTQVPAVKVPVLTTEQPRNSQEWLLRRGRWE